MKNEENEGGARCYVCRKLIGHNPTVTTPNSEIVICHQCVRFFIGELFCSDDENGTATLLADELAELRRSDEQVSELRQHVLPAIDYMASMEPPFLDAGGFSEKELDAAKDYAEHLLWNEREKQRDDPQDNEQHATDDLPCHICGHLKRDGHVLYHVHVYASSMVSFCRPCVQAFVDEFVHHGKGSRIVSIPAGELAELRRASYLLGRARTLALIAGKNLRLMKRILVE